MAKRIPLMLEERKKVGSREARRIRRNNMIPAVIYGKNIRPINAVVAAGDLHNILSNYGRNAILDLKLNDSVLTAIIKDLQYDPLTRTYDHIDFQCVDIDKPIKANVPIRIHGEGLVESKGGLVMMQLDNLEVECLPNFLPEAIIVDVSEANIGDTITVNDLPLPDGVIALSHPAEIVVVIAETKAAADENEVVNKEERTVNESISE